MISSQNNCVPLLMDFKAPRLVSPISPKVSFCLGWDQTYQQTGIRDWGNGSVSEMLPAKVRWPEFASLHPQKEPDLVLLTACNPSFEEAETGGPHGFTGRPAQPKSLNSSSFIERPHLKYKTESSRVRYLISTAGLHIHLCAHLHAHI